MPAIEQIQPLGQNLGWQTLRLHYQQMKNVHLRQLFAHDPKRGERFSIEDGGIYFDYSKNLVNKDTMAILINLAESCGLRPMIENRFSTAKAGLIDGAPHQWPSRNNDPLAQMTNFAERVWSGEWTGYTGMKMRTLVNIQIDQGEPDPVFAHQALRNFIKGGMETLFVTDTNSNRFCNVLKDLNPAETLFIISSDSFTSRETMACAHKARRWILKAMRDESAVARHFVAASNNMAEVSKFGIESGARFGFWNRFTGESEFKQSTTGFSTMMALGPDTFSRMMSGFNAMDEHFRSASFDCNLPVIWGLLGVWYSNFYGSEKLAVLPYNSRLTRLPTYLQRLTPNHSARHIIDSRHSINPIGGEEPMEVQDMLCHRIMQGITICPCDFIGFCTPDEASVEKHNLLMAKLLASTQALAFGKPEHHVQNAQAPHLPCEGNHPSNTILAERLTPEIFGRLLAFYEHSIFTQEMISRCAFPSSEDLAVGTMSAKHIMQELENGLPSLSHDSSTSCLIRHYRSMI